MTPLGLNTAAVSEAAALFPLSAAGSPAAEGSLPNGAAGSGAFGDLLAASVAQAQPQGDAENTGSGFNTLSLADIWFAGLTVDLDALNAGLEAEEGGAPGDAAAVAGAPAAHADLSDDIDEEMVALMALGAPLPVQTPDLPVIPTGAVPEVASPSTETTLNAVTVNAADLDSAVGSPVPGPPPAPEALAAEADPENVTPEGRTRELAPAPVSVAPGRELPVQPASIAQAGTVNPAAPPANVSAASVVERPAGDVSVTSQPSADATVTEALATASTAQVPRAGTGMTAQSRSLQAAAVYGEDPVAPPVVPNAPQAQAPSAGGQLAESIDASPIVQQTGRTREAVASRLAEITGLGQDVDAATKPAPGTHLAGDSQPQSQGGGAQDAFVAGFVENAAAARSADGGAATPVFTVAPPVDAATAGAARAVPVAAAALPQAPAETVPAPENIGRLVESMRVQMKDGVQEATVRLKPEHMGEVTISIRVERGAVSAVVNAETPAVRQWLESQEEKLRSGLSDQGLHLERFIVQRDRQQERREQPRQQQPAPRYRQQRDESGIRFEVLV